MSRIGKKPIAIPKDVKITLNEGSVLIEGPKGKLDHPISSRIKAEVKENQIFLSRATETKIDKSLHGLHRALIASKIKGVTEGYVKELEIIGTGFKASVQGDKLTLQLGYSHPVVYKAPVGIKIESPKLAQIIVRGINKELVGEVAAEIRSIDPPEPYKGKGIRYAGEIVKKKVGKAQATAK